MAETEHTPTISVVIPVYNVEKYVGKCLSSLLEQTFRDFEVIAVNDGSTDSTPEILRHIEARDSRVHVIDQSNAGMSQARNTGMEVARGEYIAFVDSDDFVASTYLEELYDACIRNNADISCCYYYYHFVENDFMFEYPFRCKGIFNRTQAMNKLLRDVQIQSLVWNKLYRRSLFTDYHITFPTMCFEDMAVAHRIFQNVSRVVVLDRPLYYYNQHSLSTLATINANKINDFIRAIAIVRISLEKNGLYEKYKKSYLALTRKTCNCCYLYVLKMHGEKKCMRGCMTNMRRVSQAIRQFSADGSAPVGRIGELRNVVAAPEKLEKDYLAR